MFACPYCKKVAVEVSEIDLKKKGLASFILFHCRGCANFFESYTSRSVNNAFYVNKRVVYSMNPYHHGYAKLEKYAWPIDLPKLMTLNNQDWTINYVTKAVTEKQCRMHAMNQRRIMMVLKTRFYLSLNGVVITIFMTNRKSFGHRTNE